jgi:putative two-component system response regulator
MANPRDERKTILVVDDTKENLTVLAALLGAEFRVRVANSGERALKSVHMAPVPDLILLDVMMPEMDGYAVLKALRDDPATRDIPVIFVTAMSADEDEEFGLGPGGRRLRHQAHSGGDPAGAGAHPS